MKNLDHALEVASRARLNAHCPYSGFQVGAAVKPHQHDTVYAGCNVENASYGATICAERAAVLGMVSDIGRQTIEFVLVVTDATPLAVPCAECLQVLAEFCTPETMVYLADPEAIRHSYRFGELLPYPFSDVPPQNDA
ncbi:MAG: cytidine deaminase [Spirochaetales bacterium]